MRYFDVNPNDEIGLEDGKYPFFYRDILDSHKEELESGHLSEEAISKLIHLPQDLQDIDESHLDALIFPIYNYLFSARYCWKEEVDPCCVSTIVVNAIRLRDEYWVNNESLIHDIAQKVYAELIRDYRDLMPDDDVPSESIDDADDYFNPDHLKDGSYYLNRFVGMFPDDKKLRDKMHSDLLNNIFR